MLEFCGIIALWWFFLGVTRAVALRPRDGNRPLTKRARSERRSKTLPNNVFDMFGSAFKTSSPSPELVVS